MQTTLTKKYKGKYLVFLVLSLLATIGAPAFYIIKAFIQSELIVHKTTISSAILVVLILSAIALLNKWQFRSKIWILLFAIYFALDRTMEPLIVIGTSQIVDELVFSPLARFYKSKYRINKEIDKRA